MSEERALLRLCLAIGALMTACAPPGAGEEAASADYAARRAEIRPTDGTGWNGNGYGIPAEVYDPPGNHFRVWYVTSGENAVEPRDDSPKDGIPDFVAEVGELAEATYQSTVVQRGFRPPLDDSVYHDRPDYGGDGRYDIYLRLAGAGSDGYRVTEVCTDGTDGTTPGRCSGYFVMNPTFADTHYPSERAAIEVLTSHELFHSVQDAYNAAQWRTFTEGSAVWNELQVFPTGAGTFADYIGFVPAFFSQPERPFDKSMGGGPTADYAYGSSVFVEFLSERYGPNIVREIWEGCEQQPAGDALQFLDVTDLVLQGRYASSLSAAWIEFTRWNLLTGERAQPGQGYQRAMDYPLVRFEPDITTFDQMTSVELNGLSARYLRIAPALGASTALRLTIDDATSDPPVAAAYLVSTSAGMPTLIDQFHSRSLDTQLNPGQAILLVLTGAVRGARTRTAEVTVSKISDSGPMMPPPSDEASGCHMSRASSSCCGLAMFAVLLGLLGVPHFSRRRRYTKRQIDSRNRASLPHGESQ